jgi:hypothetical protein
MRGLSFLIIFLFAASLASCEDDKEKEPAVLLKPDTEQLDFDAVGGTDIKLRVNQTAYTAPETMLVSRVVHSSEGKSYLEVDGKPYFFSNVQAMGTSLLYGHSWGDEAYAKPLPVDWLENMFEKTILPDIPPANIEALFDEAGTH